MRGGVWEPVAALAAGTFLVGVGAWWWLTVLEPPRAPVPGHAASPAGRQSSVPVLASLPISRNSARMARSMCSCESGTPSSAARKAARRLELRM